MLTRSLSYTYFLAAGGLGGASHLLESSLQQCDGRRREAPPRSKQTRPHTHPKETGFLKAHLGSGLGIVLPVVGRIHLRVVVVVLWEQRGMGCRGEGGMSLHHLVTSISLLRQLVS